MNAHVPMKAIIFAGGIGTRMWPLSRKSSPKQFEPIIEGKSTLQLAVDRLRPEFAWSDIYISTGEQYRDIIIRQLPDIPLENIIGEPQMRDCGPAVGYLMSIINRTNPDTPTAILWSDHLVERVDVFKQALFAGGDLLVKNPDRFIFIGQRPRFANQNLGWIEFGDVIDRQNSFEVREFKSWHYRPTLDLAKKYFLSGRYAWNPGYFVCTPRFVLKQYEIHAPDTYEKLLAIVKQPELLRKIYPTMAKMSFDDAVVTKTKPEQAAVISVELGWADIGTWEALKEALMGERTDNLILGQVQTLDTSNSVIYSYTDQLVTTIDVEDAVVVVTKDVVMVTHQRSIPKIKNLLKQFEGTELEKYT